MRAMARSICLLSGAPGAGRTSLAENLAELARVAGSRVVVRGTETESGRDGEWRAEALRSELTAPEEEARKQRAGVSAAWGTMTIIDGCSGSGPESITAALGCEWVLLLTHDTDGSLADTYATAKMLVLGGYRGRMGLVMNDFRDEHRARLAGRRFRRTAERFLGREVEELGMIPHDRRMLRAQRLREPLVRLSPRSAASVAMGALWARLTGGSRRGLEASGLWSQMASLFL